MSRDSLSLDNIRLLLKKALKSKLAVKIFIVLAESGEDTVKGISDKLKSKGEKASLTRVYEEISVLRKIGLVRRTSNRPPVYVPVLSREKFEEIAGKFFIDTHKGFKSDWAIISPFLSDDFNKRFPNHPFVSLYPIVDVFQTDLPDLQRYFLRFLKSKVIYISKTMQNIGVSPGSIKMLFEKEDYKPLYKVLKDNFRKYGTTTAKLLTNNLSMGWAQVFQNFDKDASYQELARYTNIEIRELKKIDLSNFIIGDDFILFLIGVSNSDEEFYSIVEMKEPKIVKKAKIHFERAWKKAKPIFKIENGTLTFS